MSVDLFEKCCRQLSPLTDEITMHLLGEPTMHPQFAVFTDIAAANKLKICLTTNGTLSENITAAYAPGKFSQINFSVHALLESYLFDKHIGKIITFVKDINAQNQPYINFRYWSILGKGAESFVSEDTRRSIEYIASRLNPSFDISIIERIDTDKKYKSVKISDKIYFHFNKRFKWPDMNDEPFLEKGFCLAMKTHFGILSDGRVTACCLDWNGENLLGNICDEDLESIINSEKAVRIKSSFEKNILPEEVCRRCDYIKVFAGVCAGGAL